MNVLQFIRYQIFNSVPLCAMSSSFVANLNLNTQDVEEGQLPNYAMPPPNNTHFQPPYGLNPHINHPPLLNEPIPHPPTHLPHAQPIFHQSTHSDIEYQTVKHNPYPMQNGYSPQPKKKSHKSSHKSSRHHHNDSQRDRQRQKQKNRNDRKQKEKEIYGSDKQNYPKEDNNQSDIQNRPNLYQRPPYYPPYMYPPMPMMPHHMPPPHMFPYPLPPPAFMHPNSYPYPPPSMMPPMSMPPPPLNYQNSKNGQPYTNQPPIFQKPNEAYRALPNDRMMRDQAGSEKSAQNNYKMFGMGGGYMYPYPPPPMPYPPYPPAPYMMYPNPQTYEQVRESTEKQQQLKLARKKQYIDNQKQKIRKSLKHLPSQQKIQMLQTIRNIVKFDSINSESNKNSTQDYTFSTEIDLFRKKTEASCYERCLLRVEEWLKQEDEKIREVTNHLLVYFELNNIKNKIKELKAARVASQEKGWSQSRHLLGRLIRFPQQKIL